MATYDNALEKLWESLTAASEDHLIDRAGELLEEIQALQSDIEGVDVLTDLLHDCDEFAALKEYAKRVCESNSVHFNSFDISIEVKIKDVEED